ncbi:MAG: Asp/Glu racemase [Solirubrobacterales bacterium]|nr:Asp/Glu racemase [Solirubrobacterales bacterium]
MSPAYRVGLIVPSSNTTMETEIPEILRRRGELLPETFTCHSSRVRMKRVVKEELDAMVQDSDRCAIELSDARVDVIAYACLVAIMAQGVGYHETAERRLASVTADNGGLIPIASSAGALVRGIRALEISRVAIVTPYMKPLTNLVVEYLADAGIEVVDAISLEIADNLDVGRHDPMLLPEIAEGLQLHNAEAVVLSACVQMPSLPAIQVAEERLGLPVLSASVATAYDVFDQLGLTPVAPRCGALLAGRLTVPV